MNTLSKINDMLYVCRFKLLCLERALIGLLANKFTTIQNLNKTLTKFTKIYIQDHTRMFILYEQLVLFHDTMILMPVTPFTNS